MQKRLILCLMLVATALAMGAVPAGAEPIGCGQVVTESIKLESDLVGCPGDGLVVGADNVSIDLNGHTIAGVRLPDPCHADCLVSGDGVANTGGYDGVRVLNGLITNFKRGVALIGVRRNRLTNLTVEASAASAEPHVGVYLLRSQHTAVVDNEAGAGDSLVLSGSSRNVILRNDFHGGISIRSGNGITLVDGSNHNVVGGNRSDGDGASVWIEDSLGNRLSDNTLFGYIGVQVRNAQRTALLRNAFRGGRRGLVLEGDDNLIRANTASGAFGDGISVTGDRNLVVGNSVDGTFGLWIRSGTRNVLRRNSVTGSPIDGLGVGIYATSTSVVDNTVTGAQDDGIDVEAPGTLLRRNTANDNGDLGLEAVPGVIDGGGNRASGNGNPLQCINVFCG